MRGDAMPVLEPVVTNLPAPTWYLLLTSSAFRQELRRCMVDQAFPPKPNQHLMATMQRAGCRIMFLVYLERARAKTARARNEDILRAAKAVATNHATHTPPPADPPPTSTPPPPSPPHTTTEPTSKGDPAAAPTTTTTTAAPPPPWDTPEAARYTAAFFQPRKLKCALLLSEADVRTLEHSPEVQGWLLRFWKAMPRQTKLRNSPVMLAGVPGAPSDERKSIELVERETFIDLHVRVHWYLLYRGALSEAALVAEPAAETPRWRTHHPNGAGAGHFTAYGSEAAPAPPVTPHISERKIRTMRICKRAPRIPDTAPSSGPSEPSGSQVEVKERQLMVKVAQADTLAFTKGERALSYDAFSRALYLLCESWTETADPMELCELLRMLFETVVDGPLFRTSRAVREAQGAAGSAEATSPPPLLDDDLLADLSPYEQRLLGIELDPDDAGQHSATANGGTSPAAAGVTSPSSTSGDAAVQLRRLEVDGEAAAECCGQAEPGGGCVEEALDPQLRANGDLGRWMRGVSSRLAEGAEGQRLQGGCGGVPRRSPDAKFVLEKVLMQRITTKLNGGERITGRSALMRYLHDKTITDAGLQSLRRLDPRSCELFHSAVEVARACGRNWAQLESYTYTLGALQRNQALAAEAALSRPPSRGSPAAATCKPGGGSRGAKKAAAGGRCSKPGGGGSGGGGGGPLSKVRRDGCHPCTARSSRWYGGGGGGGGSGGGSAESLRLGSPVPPPSLLEQRSRPGSRSEMRSPVPRQPARVTLGRDGASSPMPGMVQGVGAGKDGGPGKYYIS